jgi:hypothetical protein
MRNRSIFTCMYLKLGNKVLRFSLREYFRFYMLTKIFLEAPICIRLITESHCVIIQPLQPKFIEHPQFAESLGKACSSRNILPWGYIYSTSDLHISGGKCKILYTDFKKTYSWKSLSKIHVTTTSSGSMLFFFKHSKTALFPFKLLDVFQCQKHSQINISLCRHTIDSRATLKCLGEG